MASEKPQHYKIEKSRHEHKFPGLVRLTTRVINPDHTGYMGHTTIAESQEDSFWMGVDAAMALANDNPGKAKELDFSELLEAAEIDDVDSAANYSLGVLAIAITWQAKLHYPRNT